MSGGCDPKDVALKSFFLGPQAENGPWLRELVGEVLQEWFDWRRGLFPEDGHAISDADRVVPEFRARQERFKGVARELLRRFEGEVPKFSPRYVGHMFSEASLPALIGHLVALLHNPNNISGESSRVGIRLEDEAIAELARMIGFRASEAKGHFTSGGTLANFEALHRARERVAGARPVVLAPAHAHYSWEKGVSLLGMGAESLWRIPLDAAGRLSLEGLEALLERAAREQRPVALVVSVAGTTELGAIDPIGRVQELLERRSSKGGERARPWHHVDAAYGGFFRTLESAEPAALADLGRADSVTLDPHKLGYVPYSSGAFLARTAERYFCQSFGAPYVQFDPTRDKGLFTIEGSRSAAGAVATWMTARSIGLDAAGYGRILGMTIDLKRDLEERLAASGLSVRVAPHTDTNILAFCVADHGESLDRANSRTRALYEVLSPEAGGPFTVSKTTLRRAAYGAYLDAFAASFGARSDGEPGLELIRLCLMNPFFGSREMARDFRAAFIECLRAAISAAA